LKIVLDTNVLVSGLIHPFGPPGEIVRMVSSGVLEICHDSRVLSEYREVLLRPRFGFEKKDVDALLEQIKFTGHVVAGEVLSRPLPDPDDEVFLEIALAAKIKYLVTGNIKHFPVSTRQKVQVVSPAQFLEIYRSL